jgi:hypothetical protein
MPAGRSWRARWSELPRSWSAVRRREPVWKNPPLRSGNASWRGRSESATMWLNMIKYLTISAALWVLLTPILCMGGVLDHHCDCEAEMACRHEAECAADPCRALVAVRSNSRTIPRLAHESFPAPVCATGPYALLTLHGAPPLRRSSDEHAPDDCRLPFPRSDLPLLL